MKNRSLQGPFVIVSGPSGVGKTRFVTKGLECFPRFSNTVSWTTRLPRKGEKEGEFYRFIDTEEFERLKSQGELLEWAKVHNAFYASSKREVERLWAEGKAILKDIDVQGCESIKKIFPESVSVFIYPPSMKELKERIVRRGLNSKEQLDIRLSQAEKEIARASYYDFKVLNDNFDEAWEEFKAILSQSLKSFKPS